MGRPRKLGHGEGSVYFESATGRWRGEVRGEQGQRRRVSGSTRKEATEKLDELRRQIADGLPVGDDTRLGSWIQWWQANVGAAKSPRTADHDRWALAQLDQIKGKRLRDLTVADVEGELHRLATRKTPKRSGRGGRKGPLGRSALVKVRRALAEVLTEAERRDMIGRNVAKLTRIPVGAKAPTSRRSLTPEQARKLIAASVDDLHYALIVLMLHCGLRPGEATGLPWDAIDFEEGTLTVRQSRRVLPNGRMVIGPTKTKSDRVLATPALVMEALRSHKVRQKADRLAAPVWEDFGLVFCNEIGRPIDPSNLRREVRRLCEKAEIEPITPYELRHSTASLLVDGGSPLEEVADMLGHKDVRMLAQVYRHRVKRVVDLTEAQERMLSGG